MHSKKHSVFWRLDEETALRPGRKAGAAGGFGCQAKKPELCHGSVRVIEGLI